MIQPQYQSNPNIHHQQRSSIQKYSNHQLPPNPMPSYQPNGGLPRLTHSQSMSGRQGPPPPPKRNMPNKPPPRASVGHAPLSNNSFIHNGQIVNHSVIQQQNGPKPLPPLKNRQSVNLPPIQQNQQQNHPINLNYNNGNIHINQNVNVNPQNQMQRLSMNGFHNNGHQRIASIPDSKPLPFEPIEEENNNGYNQNVYNNNNNNIQQQQQLPAKRGPVKADPNMRPFNWNNKPLPLRPKPVHNEHVSLEHGNIDGNAEWKCAVCTYSNQSNHLKCSMCGLPQNKKPPGGLPHR